MRVGVMNQLLLRRVGLGCGWVVLGGKLVLERRVVQWDGGRCVNDWGIRSALVVNFFGDPIFCLPHENIHTCVYMLSLS